MITPEQIRGARAMTGMTQADLARKAGISTTGLNNIERGSADPKISTLRAIQTALESSGVLFVPENGEGPGVRLRKGVAATLAAPSSVEALEAGAAHARRRAGTAADSAMAEMDASDDEKAARRSALVDEPAVVAKARRKRKGSSDEQ